MPAAAAIIPVVAALGSKVMKGRAQSKAAKQAAENEKAQMGFERDKELRGINEWNTNRTTSVNKRRDLLKAMIMNKGWGGSKVWDNFGGMDAYFGRPVGGLKSTSEFAYHAPEAKTGGGGGWNMLGDLVGAGGQAYSAYKNAQDGKEASEQMNIGKMFGQGDGTASGAMARQNEYNDFADAYKASQK